VNVESARRLVQLAVEARDTATRNLDTAHTNLVKAQRDFEAAKDRYADTVSLLNERERLLRELVIREAGGQHP
jgi:hypothetical protein